VQKDLKRCVSPPLARILKEGAEDAWHWRGA
jgi:hypothetical protein